MHASDWRSEIESCERYNRYGPAPDELGVEERFCKRPGCEQRVYDSEVQHCEDCISEAKAKDISAGDLWSRQEEDEYYANPEKYDGVPGDLGTNYP